jgi:hypothetical protein
MTERKPAGMSFTSWIDQQINEARDRGAFDNLPGAGKPLPRRRESDDGLTWVRDLLRREGLPTDELLPTPLKLRRQSERLAESAGELGSEQEVRAAVAELNRQIAEWRRIPNGPPIFVRLIDADAMVGLWRERRAAPAPEVSRPEDAGRPARIAAVRPGRSSFWHRLRRHGARRAETGRSRAG